MHLPRWQGARACLLVVAACVGLAGPLGPASTLADTDLVVGGEAVVAYAQGDNVRVRDGASFDSEIVTKVPEGTTLTVLDGPLDDGAGGLWYRVDVDGVTGYIVSDYLANSTGILAAPSGTAVATDNVHLRSGPAVAYYSIDKIPAGDVVTIAGESMDGWLRVTWNGLEGWAYGAFFTGSGVPDVADPAPESEPAEETPATEAPAEEPVAEPPVEAPVAEPPVEAPVAEDEAIEAGTRYTSDPVNFRTEPSLESTVLEVLPAGVAVELTGRSQAGFAEGSANGATGWVSLDYLTMDPPVVPELDEALDQQLSEQPETAAPDEAEAPAATGSTITWPMRGGEWYIGQGYNGSSHQNSGSLWQYQYSFDLARTDENTGGEAVYSPVSGTVRWLDPSTGGISIDVGGGLAVALFHIDIDPSVTEGDSLSQGQYIGVVSYPGGGGNGGWSHIHLTAWRTDDGGNWSREAIPFEGIAAIDGQDYPNDGSSQAWRGTIINP